MSVGYLALTNTFFFVLSYTLTTKFKDEKKKKRDDPGTKSSPLL
jgi:hypothetical protein